MEDLRLDRTQTVDKRIHELSLEFFVGLFFIMALLILLYFTAVVNGKDLLLGRTKFTMKVRFPSVSTLEANNKVYFRGMPVGTVREFTLDEKKGGVIVLLTLDKELTLYKDYCIEIRSTSLLGGKHVHIDNGTPANPVVPGDSILEGAPPLDILHQASTLIASLEEDEKLFREKILHNELLDNISKAFTNFREISDSLKSGEGTLGKLLQDSSLFDSINTSSKEIAAMVQDARAGKGTIGKLLTDDSVHKQLQSALKDVNSVTNSIAEGKGTLGKIINDEGKLYDDMSVALESMKKITVQMAEGKGTIGKLLLDQELYDKTKAAIEQLQGAVEDYREQAPIATFGSMIFGAL